MVIGCREMDLWENILPQVLSSTAGQNGADFLRQTVFRSAPNGFPFCGKRFFNLLRTVFRYADIHFTGFTVPDSG